MKFPWRYVLVGAALMAGVLLAACGGDEEEDAGSPAAASPTVATEEAAPTETPTEVGTPAAAETPPADEITAELAALSDKWASTPAKVTYRYSYRSDGDTGEATHTQYWRPPDARRWDRREDSSILIEIAVGGGGYLCSMEDGEGFCTPMEAAPVLSRWFVIDPASIRESMEMVPGVEIKRSTRTIAGEKATCFSAAAEASGKQSRAEYCFASDGILLLHASSYSSAEDSFDSESRVEATEVSRQVSDADFEPPYPVVE